MAEMNGSEEGPDSGGTGSELRFSSALPQCTWIPRHRSHDSAHRVHLGGKR